MAEFYRESKKYRFRHLIIGLIIGGVLLLIIIAGLNRNGEEATNIQSTKNTQEETLNIYSAGEEVKVGKSIWILKGVIDKGWVLKKGFKVEQVYKIKDSSDSKLIGVILEFVNMTEISDEIYEEFKKGAANIKFKGSISTTLIDNKNERFRSLSSDEAYYVLPDDVDSRLDDIYTKYIKDPDLYPIFTFFYLVPADAKDFKVEVRDETTYSNEKALIDLGL